MPCGSRLSTLFFVTMLTSTVVGCAGQSGPDEEVAGENEAAYTDPRTAVTTPWDADLWRSPAPGRPSDAWPGVFDQPRMARGPGSCGVTATANLTAQLLSRPGAEATEFTPWSALERAGYNVFIGIHPRRAIDLLEEVFRDPALVGDAMVGTKFVWHHEGRRNEEAAWSRLRESLEAQRPFIALVNYRSDGKFLDLTGNHYVVVVAALADADDSVVIAHQGRYEKVSKEKFLLWWSAHTYYAYAGIYPDHSARLAQAR